MDTHEGFTSEQKDYLKQLIEGLDLHVAFQGPAAASEAVEEPAVYGTPFEDLCTEEQIKAGKHPWDLYTDFRRHAEANRLPKDGNVFLFKHHGLFSVKPAQSGFMCRLRVPACSLRGDQLVRLGEIATELAGGYAYVTTRGNLQLREIAPKNITKMLTAVSEAGLTSKGAGGDSVRNITCTPTAGFDIDELIDLSPYAIELHHEILNTRDLHGIPRKFNIAFDCGGTTGAVADTNDICFAATEVHDGAGIPAGVYCRILLGGITGHGDFAADTGLLVRPEQTVDTAVAMLKVFVENGDRTNRKKARLKYLLDRWGLDEFCRHTQEKLDFPLIAVSADRCAPRRPINRSAHIGVHSQKQEGLNYIGVALHVGKLLPEQMQGLGDIAARYGSNTVRLTVWQNLLIPNIPTDSVDQALREIRFLGLEAHASSFAAGAVACTGRFGCKYASSHTKEHASAIVSHLQERFELDTPINIHLTGCTHSCAQHYIGDIGLLGASVGEGDDQEEGYQVYLGGGADTDQGLARYLTGPVPARLLLAFMEHLISQYLDRRLPGESFLSFARRHTEDELKEIFLTPAKTEVA